MAFAKKTFAENQLKSPSPKKNSYRTKAYTSEVDETLFGTPTRFTQQVETKHLHDEKEWDPPWVTGPTKNGAPLLWTPFTLQDLQGSDYLTKKIQQNSLKASNPHSARSTNKYRLRSRTPSYVDESLFESKKLNKKSLKMYWESNENLDNFRHLWSTRCYDVDSPKSDDSFDNRPGSRLGKYNDPYIPPTPRDDNTFSSKFKSPIIKHRSDSNIKTSSNGLQTQNNFIGKDKLKLNFNQDLSEKEELIERALRLARQAQEAAIASSDNSNRKQAWSRPNSTKGSSPRISDRKGPRFSDFIDVNSLSATGVQIPLSARESELGNRPDTSRLSSRSTRRPQSARLSSDRPNWKL